MATPKIGSLSRSDQVSKKKAGRSHPPKDKKGRCLVCLEYFENSNAVYYHCKATHFQKNWEKMTACKCGNLLVKGVKDHTCP